LASAGAGRLDQGYRILCLFGHPYLSRTEKVVKPDTPWAGAQLIWEEVTFI